MRFGLVRWLFIAAVASNGRIRPTATQRPRLLQRPLYVDFVEKRPSLAFAGGRRSAASRAKLGLCALCGEDRRRKGDELCQFPQVLGGGGQ